MSMSPRSSMKRSLSWSALAALATIAAGCGGVSTSQASARDQATTVTCDWFAGCDQVGNGKTYSSRSSCEIDIRARWEGAWPADACEGHINGDNLSLCLSAIRATECANGFDLLLTLGKCSQDKVCSGSSGPHPG
jgi:hypothetical protein